MKIILVHKFWRKVGGAEVYFQDTARILRNNGHQVKIFTTDYDAEGSKDVYERTPDVIFGSSPEYLKGGFVSRLTSIPEVIYSRKNKTAFTSLLREFKPDIVHVFALYVSISPSILDACREEGVPVVMSCNDYKHICPNYRLFHHGKICNDCKGGKFYHAVTNNCCKHSLAVSTISALEAYVHSFWDIYKKNVHTFLFESRFMMDKTEEFWGKGTARLEYLGKPFDASAYDNSEKYEDYLLFIGRLSDEKGVDVLLNAMKLVPEAKLKIAGDGPYREHLEGIKRNLGLHNAEFLGAVWGEESGKLMSNCRFVVIPSLWYENFPYVLTETYARGKAVIGSDKGGIPEYIQEGVTGMIYPAESADRLADCIKTLWNSPERTAEMGKNARKLAINEFRDDVFYRRISHIYQKVCG